MNPIFSIWKRASILGKFAILGCGGLFAVVSLFVVFAACSLVLNLGTPLSAPSAEPQAIAQESQKNKTSEPSPRPTATIIPTGTPASEIETPMPASTTTASIPSPTTEITTFPGESATQVMLGIVNANANVREAPSTSGRLIKTLQKGNQIEILARSEQGDWLQIEEGWIFAELVDLQGDESALPIVSAPAATSVAEEQNPVPATEVPNIAVSTTEPQVPPTSPPSTQVTITSILFDGDVPEVESDEYAEITNTSGAAIDMSGWRLSAGDGQDFRFPEGFVLQPNQSCRVYTNQIHPETCGLSFANENPVWNNGGECGSLFNAQGEKVSEKCY